MKKIFLALLSGVILFGCNKPEVGFFSEDGIRMKEDTMQVIRGVYQVSGIPDIDGSTRPMNFEVVGMKNLKTGEPMDDFLQVHPIQLWREPFDAKTDTTMAQVNEKLYVDNLVPLMINPYSGQMQFNAGTLNLPVGTYGIDIRISNTRSSVVYENFCVCKLISKPFEVPGNFGDYFKGITAQGVEITIKDHNPYPADEIVQVKENTHPLRKIYKLGESDIVELTMVVKDSEGNPFRGSDIEYLVDEANLSSFYNCYHDNSLAMDGGERVVLTDTSCVFHFPTVPYPAFGRKYNDGDNVYLVYYNISPEAYTLTPEAQQLANEVSGNENKIFETYRVSFKNSYKINEPGKWLIEVVSPNVIRK